MDPVVFVDMDGVVADFNGRVLELAGMPGAKGEPGEYEIFKALGITHDRLWEIINGDPGFWPGLEPYPWAKDLVRSVAELVGQENTYFFTSPSRNPQSTAGKVEWIYQHFPAYKRQFFIGPHKWQCASTRTVLIDDRDSTVKRFQEYGGWALLYPQHWNSYHIVEEDHRFEFTLQNLRATLFVMRKKEDLKL